MSRITRSRINPGNPLEAADLNNRYADFTQTDLDDTNVADHAVDAAQVSSSALLINAHQANYGSAVITHGSALTLGRATSGPATPVALGAATGIALGSGWTINTDEVLRIYANSQVRGVITASTSPHGTLDGSVTVNTKSTGTTPVCIGAHVWLVQLQWDITSASRTNFVNVPNQGNFQSTWSTSGRYGEPLSNLAGTAAFPAFWSGGINWRAGRTDGLADTEERGTGWRNIALTFHFAPGSTTTVYGLRLVMHGIYHPRNDGTNNGLVLDVGSTPGISAEYQSSNILALHMKED